jgi:hypothetical protein
MPEGDGRWCMAERRGGGRVDRAGGAFTLNTHRVIPAKAGIHVRGLPRTSSVWGIHRMDSGRSLYSGAKRPGGRNDIVDEVVLVATPPS